MAVYGVHQSGGLRQVGPGEFLRLLDGTEANAQVKSAPFARGYSGGQSVFNRTFNAVGLGASETVDIQEANNDVDAEYQTIGTMTSELASPAGTPFFTDSGAAAFYRVVKSGGTCVVNVQA